MATQLQNLKYQIGHNGESWISALEQVDVDQLRAEGEDAAADKICKVLELIDELCVIIGSGD